MTGRAGSGRGRGRGILLFKMGSTLSSLKAWKGDFEDWIIAGMGLTREEVTVVDVTLGGPLPPLDGHGAIVITGSHAMVTERRDWSERAAGWLREAVSRDLHVLGICYGHQLLAHALGGKVGNNPKGREFGTVEVALEQRAGEDRLLGGLPSRIRVHVGHTQSVLRLPEGAVRLASNSWDGNQAFRIGSTAWGVQFHPEFDAEIMREYITHYRVLLSAEGQDTDRILYGVSDTIFGVQRLHRFARVLAGIPENA